MDIPQLSGTPWLTTVRKQYKLAIDVFGKERDDDFCGHTFTIIGGHLSVNPHENKCGEDDYGKNKKSGLMVWIPPQRQPHIQ